MIQNIEQQKTMQKSSSYLALELGNALRDKDDAAVWSIIAQNDQEEGYKALATLVPRLTYRAAARQHFAEMFVMPIVMPAGSRLEENRDLMRAANYAITEALQTWLNPKLFDTKTVFAGIKPYDAFSLLRPNDLRQYLYRTIPGQAPGTVSQAMSEIVLPKEAPRLGFYNMVLTSERGWPGLPGTNTTRDMRLKEVVGFALSSDFSMPRPVVLTPDRLQYAVPDAISLWLVELDEAVGIAGWSVNLTKNSSDVVRITLLLRSEEVPTTQFVVRQHQVGAQGLQDILSVLASTATYFEKANDGPDSEEKAQPWDLILDESVV